jgi:outer membrane protein OmpA-like peptidoglycan-associated protein
MSSRIGVVPSRLIATSVALAFVLCLLGTFAAAQVTIQPQDEVYAGYSWLHPGGHYDYGVQTKDNATGVDFSNVFYLPKAHNLGVLVDSSMNWGTKYGDDNAANYYVLGGLQYKYHTNSFSPFFRVFAGGVRQVAPSYIDEWNAALGVGGGFDYNVWHGSMGGHDPVLAIRVAQVDYIYSNYHPIFPYTSPQWNSVRLSAGLVLGLGNYYTPPLAAACTAQPATVMEGAPVTVTATGTNFNSKHPINYAWTTNGGKLQTSDKQSAQIDTTGVAGGNYTANATVSDPKMKKGGSATCAAPFTVTPRPMNPPVVSCSANPPAVQAGTAVTINVTASSPDPGVTIAGYAYATTAGTFNPPPGSMATTATLDTTGVSAGPINVTVTATDSRSPGLTGTCTATVTVETVPAKPVCTKINSIQFPDLKRPWRVDNTAKAILDDVASRLKADPNAKIAIVGYADGEKAPTIGSGKKRHPMDLAGQRAVNAKAYLVQQQGIDPSRVDVRQGTGQQKVADIFWCPQGADENTSPDLQGTTQVDETVVKPSENAYPKPRKAAPAHHHKKAAAPAEQAAPPQ